MSELLLHTASSCVTDLLMSDSIRDALPKALSAIETAVHIDRMIVIETAWQGEIPVPNLLFVWEKPDAEPHASPLDVIPNAEHRNIFQQWLHPLYQGDAVVGSQRTSTGPVKDMLVQLGTLSVLHVPIMVNGKFWGHIAFEDYQSERDWSSAEIGILKMLAGLIGTAITRERSMAQVRQRDALLSAVTSSAVEIMTAPYLHEAISKSLETVAKAMHADRMFVLEVVLSTYQLPQLLLRNSWHAAGVTLEADTLLRSMSASATPEILQWAAPLQQGQATTGKVSTATPGLQEVFKRMKLLSTLLVPIMVDGKYWGHVSFDDCHHERDWTSTEVDILKTLAELIGTAITRERFVEELAKANTIVQNSPTILYRLRGEPAFPMIYISQNISLLGLNAAELLNSPTLYQTYVHPEDRTKVQSTMVELLRRNAQPATIEYRMINSAGESRWMENRYLPVRDTNGRLVEVEGIMIDITERKLAEERIALLARTDVLTGLANRSTFHDRLRQVFAATKRGATSFAVLYLDLDRFKEVNDTRGHPIGDKLLQAVAERLKSITRETDVVARLGGDEFAILQTDVLDSAFSGALAAKVVTTLSVPYIIDGIEIRIGASVGIALFSPDATSPDTLLVQADQALYRAKEEGRGQYRFHSVELDHAARELVLMAEDLRNAMARNELELFYQPQVELSTGRIIGMEALIRWVHPTRGLLLPDVFLPIAEKTGITLALGRWVLDGACKQLAEWRKGGMNVPVVAVNIALAQIKTGREFLRDVKNSLDRWGLKPRDLELDVTEFILARATLSQSNVLEELRQLGVCIAIDDFGAQYSSLDYLRTYRVSRLKIARPMVKAATDEGGSAMIRAIVGLASELGVEVVAEGVETEAQRSAIVSVGARTKGQGYYFGRPAPAEDTLRMLRLSDVGTEDKKEEAG